MAPCNYVLRCVRRLCLSAMAYNGMMKARVFKMLFYNIRCNTVTHIVNSTKTKTFSVVHTVIETRVEVWENQKLKWEHEPVGRVFPHNLKLHETLLTLDSRNVRLLILYQQYSNFL